MAKSSRRSVLLTRREKEVRPKWPPLRKALRQILEDHEIEGTLSVVLVADDDMSRLHEEFLGDPTPTDVLSFPLLDAEGPGPELDDAPFGEVVVSVETAAREAARRGLPTEREVALYAIHGTLHLAGYDDHDSADRRVMRRLEKRYVEHYRRYGGE